MAAFAYGSVSLTATPEGWTGTPITCQGDLYGGLGIGYYYVPDLMTYISAGTYSDVDYAATLSPDASQGNLIWQGMCPVCLLYTSPSPRDRYGSRMPSSA